MPCERSFSLWWNFWSQKMHWCCIYIYIYRIDSHGKGSLRAKFIRNLTWGRNSIFSWLLRHIFPLLGDVNIGHSTFTWTDVNEGVPEAFACAVSDPASGLAASVPSCPGPGFRPWTSSFTVYTNKQVIYKESHLRKEIARQRERERPEWPHHTLPVTQHKRKARGVRHMRSGSKVQHSKCATSCLQVKTSLPKMKVTSLVHCVK